MTKPIHAPNANTPLIGDSVTPSSSGAVGMLFYMRVSDPNDPHSAPTGGQTASKESLRSNFVGHKGAEPEALHKFFDEIIRLGMQFKTQSKVKTAPMSTPAVKSFDPFPTNGISYEELIQCYAKIAAPSTNWASPNFMGFPDSGNAAPALGAALLVPFLNQNLANQEICAPVATFIEMEVVHWLRQLLGYQVLDTYTSSQDAGGVLTLGGTLSNTVALMAARENAFPGTVAHGLPVPAQKVRLLVPDVIEHYSIRSAMAWLGLGEQNLVRVPVDDVFRVQLDDLDRCIDEERAKGNYVMACVAYAGDSRSMRVDNLDNIADRVHKKGVWFHVDACHGSMLAFSRTHRHKIRGINKADSITIDPHKVLWVPYTCSFVLFKNPKSLSRISTNSDLILKTQWSLGQITPCIGSKSFDALKLWSNIKFFGQSGIEQLIDQRLELTKQIQNQIRQRPDLLLLNETDINSCMFIFVPRQCQERSALSAADIEKLNDINKDIRSGITEAGQSFVHGFHLKRCPHMLLPDDQAVYVLRTMNGNPLTAIENVHLLLDNIVSLGHRLLSECRYKTISAGTGIHDLPVTLKLQSRLAEFFGNVQHAAVIYGSSTCGENSLLSDIHVMVFAHDEFCTPSNTLQLKHIFTTTMEQEGVSIDAEIPLERKLLIPLSFAELSARAAAECRWLVNGKIPSIPKSNTYLSSDEMLHRLVLNVLTSPQIPLSGSQKLIGSICHEAEVGLVKMLEQSARNMQPGRTIADADSFVRMAIEDGDRTGKAYLGYKDRPEIIENLRKIWSTIRPTSSPGLATGKPLLVISSHL